MTDKEPTKELKEKTIKAINQFRFAMLDLQEKRTPTIDDIIILQENLADQIHIIYEQAGGR